MTHSLPARPRFRRMLLATAPALLAGLAVAIAGPALAASGTAKLAPASALAFKQPTRTPETVLATVNGVPITQAYLTAADEDLGPLLILRGPQRDAYLLDYVIDNMLVARLAERNKLDQAPGFSRRLTYEKTKMLDRGVLSKVAAEATSDTAMQAAAQKAQSDLILELRKAATIERASSAAKN